MRIEVDGDFLTGHKIHNCYYNYPFIVLSLTIDGHGNCYDQIIAIIESRATVIIENWSSPKMRRFQTTRGLIVENNVTISRSKILYCVYNFTCKRSYLLKNSLKSECF